MTTPGEPVLAVLLLSTLAAVVGALGALPFGLPRPPAQGVVGGAYALASGFMLGAGYLLVSRGLDRATVAVVVGAGVGVGYTHLIHLYAGLDDLEPTPAVPTASTPSADGVGEVAESDAGGAALRTSPGMSRTGMAGGAARGYQVLLQNALHSAAEGIAIGFATVLDLRLGIFLALALAVHNVAESMALTEILRRQGATVAEAAGLCVVAKITTPVLALAAFALAPVMTPLLPAALGFAAGCLVFLVLTELLPASYRRAAKLPVGVLVSVAAGAMVLLEHLFMRAAG